MSQPFRPHGRDHDAMRENWANGQLAPLDARTGGRRDRRTAGSAEAYFCPFSLMLLSPPISFLWLYSLSPCLVSQILRALPSPARHTCQGGVRHWWQCRHQTPGAECPDAAPWNGRELKPET